MKIIEIKPPPALTQTQIHRLSYLNAIIKNNAEKSLKQKVTKAEIVNLKEREELLNHCLRQTPIEVVEILVLPILVVMTAKIDEPADARFVRQIYAEVLSELPQFAIAKACEDFLAGRSGTGKWRSTPGEIFQRAEHHAKPVQAELKEIQNVLTALSQEKPVTPHVNREKHAKVLRNLSAEIKTIAKNPK